MDGGIATREVLETSIVFAIGSHGGDACLFRESLKVKPTTWRTGSMMAQEHMADQIATIATSDEKS